MKIKIFVIILSINTCIGSGLFSRVNENAIFYSIDYFSDNLSYVNGDLGTVDIKSKLYNAIIGFVLNGKYEILINYSKNSSPINNYMLPYKDSYISMQFLYHLKDIDKIPIEFKFGIRAIDSMNNSFYSNSMIVGIYKELAAGNYPIIPYGDVYLSINASQNDQISVDDEYKFGVHIKLIVDYLDNNILKDILWISPHINTADFNHYYLGFNLGLYHPFK